MTDRNVVTLARSVVAVGGVAALAGSVVLVLFGGQVVVAFTAATAVMVASYGIAVGRYRLYDIDLVISRTLAYGTLALCVTALYVAVVAGLGRLLGGGDDPNATLALLATAGIAVAFQPLRQRLQRAADRIVYGRSLTPHEVLSEFSRVVAAADDRLLEKVARSLVEGTGADRAAVWVSGGGRLVERAGWPGGDGPDEGLESKTASCPIEHDGVELGRLTLSSSSGRHLSEEDLELARRVASGLGLALRNRLLTVTLQNRVEALRESRRRLVAARDEARRRLERDLHDGAQQQLVALKVKLGVARVVADHDGAIGVGAQLRWLAGEADAAIDAVRDFARGVYPPLLEAEGLPAAVTAAARRSPVPATVEVGEVARYAPAVEAAVYFCVVELIQSIQSMQSIGSRTRRDPAPLRVRLYEAGGEVVFEVICRDLPPGSARAAGESGAFDLVGLADRLGAVDGSIEIRSEPDGATSMRGSVPATPSLATAGTALVGATG